MKNLHKIQPNLPEYVIRLAEIWYTPYNTHYPLTWDSKEQTLYYKYDKGELKFDRYNQNSSEEAAIKHWLSLHVGWKRTPFTPDMIKIR